MTLDANNPNCAAFQVRLPDLAGSGEKIAADPHLQSCEHCRTLLADCGNRSNRPSGTRKTAPIGVDWAALSLSAFHELLYR